MNEKMEAETSKEIYKKQKVIVEPVFEQIKNTGFRGFNVRGYEKQAANSLLCVLSTISKKS